MADEVMNFDTELTDEIRAEIPALLGEGFEDTKLYDNMKTVGDVFKAHAHTKSAFDKKQENVIQRPGEDAEDEEKAEFRKILAKELGAPDSVDAYDITKPEGIPDELKYSEDVEKGIKELALKHNISPAALKEFSEYLYKSQSEELASAIAGKDDAADAQFEKDSLDLQNDFMGEDLPKSLRGAFLAMKEYCDKERVEQLNKSGLFDKPEDLKLWRENGLDTGQLRVWINIAKDMMTPEWIRGKTLAKDDTSQYAKNKRMYPESSELWGDPSK